VKILVTGATGFVGSRLVQRLAGSGASVRALVRNRARAQVPAGVEVVVADVTRADSLPPALAQITHVVHCAAITANLKEPYRQAYDDINRVGTKNLVAAARSAAVERLVVMSGIVICPAPAGSYMATRCGMEAAVKAGGIPHVILEPSVLFGDGAEFIRALAGVARWSPVMPLIGGGGLRFQPLWIDDLLTCLEKSLTSESVLGRSIPLGGAEYATFAEVNRTILEALHIRRLLLPVPLWVMKIQAALMAAVLAHPPLTPATLELFGFENAAELDGVEHNFGFKPRAFREHLLAHGIDG